MERYAEHWAFIDGAERAFSAIAERFPVGVFTNGFAATQRAKLSRFPALRDRLSATVITEDVGALKPHPDVFAHATRPAGVGAAHILYVGDSYRSDVKGGRAAGWQVAWYAPGETREAGHERESEDAGGFRFGQWEALLQHL